MSTDWWSKLFETLTVSSRNFDRCWGGAFTINDTEHMSDKTINNTNFNTYEAILDNDCMIEEIK